MWKLYGFGIGKLCPSKSLYSNLTTTQKNHDFPELAHRRYELNQETGSSYN